MKIHKIQGDITRQIANSIKNYCSIDCEMSGLVPERDKLSIVSLTGDDENVYIVQPNKQYEAPNLVSVLENEKILKLFHFARMDVHFLDVYLKTNVKNYFCTKLMSRLSRTWTSNHGLKDLCSEICNVKLDKKYGNTTDWSKGLDSISDNELNYAAKDCFYLKKIKDSLEKILKRENRFDLFLSTMKGLESRIKLDKAGFKDPDIFEH
tara:strand:- start:70 stop:693 length:624 start_codon:yes stop_codon:yes gene_type:complete